MSFVLEQPEQQELPEKLELPEKPENPEHTKCFYDESQNIVVFADVLRAITNDDNSAITVKIVGAEHDVCPHNVYGLTGQKVTVQMTKNDFHHEVKKEQHEKHVEDDDKEDYTICRLTMIRCNLCMICNGTSESCRILSLEHLMGWVYCDTCLQTGRLRKIVLGHINKFRTIPLYFLMKSTNNDLHKEYYPTDGCADVVTSTQASLVKSKIFITEGSLGPTVGSSDMNADYQGGYLHFFRYSKRDTMKPVHSGFISGHMDSGMRIICKDRNKDFHIPLSFRDNETGEETHRLVSLGNIMAHTPGFYEELVRSSNLLLNDMIKIAFADLSVNLQNDIHEVFRNVLTVPKTSFEL